MASSGPSTSGSICDDGRGERGAALRIGFVGECFERGGDADLAGGGQVVAGGVADFGRWVGELRDERGDPLRIVGRGGGGGHAGIGKLAAGRGQLLGAGQLQHALRAELVDERGPLGVGEFECRRVRRESAWPVRAGRGR